MKEKWPLFWLCLFLAHLTDSEDKTPLGYMCQRNNQCLSDCCDVSECKVASKCDKLFGVWTIIGIVALLIVVILITIWIVAACCGYCTCILCCLKEKFRRRREKKHKEEEAQIERTTDIPLSDPHIMSFMDPEEQERYRVQLALSYPNKEPNYIPPDRLAQMSQFTIESVALKRESRTPQLTKESEERPGNVSIDVPL